MKAPGLNRCSTRSTGTRRLEKTIGEQKPRPSTYRPLKRHQAGQIGRFWADVAKGSLRWTAIREHGDDVSNSVQLNIRLRFWLTRIVYVSHLMFLIHDHLEPNPLFRSPIKDPKVCSGKISVRKRL